MIFSGHLSAPVRVTVAMKSSRGGDPYGVMVELPSGAAWCPCVGAKNHGHCRHGDSLAAWARAVVPRYDLPE